MSDRLNVLFFVTDTRSCVHFVRLGIALAKKGYRVVLLSETEGRSDTFLDELQKYNIDRYAIDKIGNNPLVGFLGLKRILCENEIDLVHSQGVMESVKVRILNVKNLRKQRIITTVNSVPGLEGSMKVGARGASFLLNKCSDFVVCPSNYVRNLLMSNGLTKDKGVVVYNSIDVDWFDRTKVVSAPEIESTFHFINPDIPNIVCVARLEPEKGIEYLLEAVKKVLRRTMVNVLIIGDGSIRKELQKRASALAISRHVFFPGWVTNDRMPFVLYNIADVCVLPSLKELLPFFVLESMAAARPIVSTSVGGIQEAVFDGFNGHVVQPRDSDSLANAISKLIQSKKLANQMGANSRRIIEEKFSIQESISQLETVYNAAVHGTTIETYKKEMISDGRARYISAS